MVGPWYPWIHQPQRQNISRNIVPVLNPRSPCHYPLNNSVQERSRSPNIYSVLSVITSVKATSGTWEDVCGLCANTALFYVKKGVEHLWIRASVGNSGSQFPVQRSYFPWQTVNVRTLLTGLASQTRGSVCATCFKPLPTLTVSLGNAYFLWHLFLFLKEVSCSNCDCGTWSQGSSLVLRHHLSHDSSAHACRHLPHCVLCFSRDRSDYSFPSAFRSQHML